MAENGQNGESRLDRIERLFATHVVRNEEAHEWLEREHKALLTSQVVLNGNLVTLTDNVQKLTMNVHELTLNVQELRGAQDSLVRMVDEWIRNNPRGANPA